MAGFFWLHDIYYLEGGKQALKHRPVGTVLVVSSVLAGAFICVAGTYVIDDQRPLSLLDKLQHCFLTLNSYSNRLQLINDAYRSGVLPSPPTCQ